MSSASTLQTYLADATSKTADALLSVYLNLPEHKKTWNPTGAGRSAIDQMAECAIINGGIAAALRAPESAKHYDMSQFEPTKLALCADWETLRESFETNTAQLIEAIKGVPTDKLTEMIELPIGTWTHAHCMGHPYWNMAYHEGQINYIATLSE